MIFGNTVDFAIKVDIEECINSWVFGQFLFYVAGETIGNANDSTDLLGCRRWLRDFLMRPKAAADEGLARLSPGEFFATVYDPAMVQRDWRSAKYPDAFRRFSISHVGMSSFNRFDVLLVGLPGGGHRLLWREGESEARSRDLGPGVFCRTVSDCLQWMDATFPKSTINSADTFKKKEGA